MKLGVEVEGRFKGLYTLFMSSEEALDFFKFKSLKQRALPEGAADSVEKVRHIYVSDTNLLDHLEYDAECFAKWHELGLPVTYETSRVVNRSVYPSNVHIMLRIDEVPGNFNSFWALKGTDQIKFSWEQLVYCVTKENMSKTVPSDFKDDIEFVAQTDPKFWN